MAARGDGPEGDELGADWLFGQLADDSAAEAATPDGSDSPQAAPRSAWWSRRARSGETAPVEPVVDAGADASGAPPVSQSATAPGDESLDWFSLATPAASAAPARPGAPVEPSQPSLPSQPEAAPVDAVPAPFWAPTPQPPREPAPDAFDAPRTPPAPPARPPADPVLTSVEPPVTPRYAPEPPAVPGPATPAAPFALTWGDEAAPTTPAAPVTPTAPATPAAPVTPTAPAAPAPSAPQSDESGLLGAPRRPRTWDEFATGAVADPPSAPVEPVAPAAPFDSPAPDSAARAAAAPEREPWSNDPFAPPARPVAAASTGFDEELWSALQEPEASTPAVDRHPGTAQLPAVDEGVSGAPRAPFPAFASADRGEPAAEPAPPVDDLLASLTRPAPRPAAQPDERADDEQPASGRVDPGPGRAGLAGPTAAGGAGLAGAVALGDAAGLVGTGASGAGATADGVGGASDLAALLGGRRADDAPAPSEPASDEHDDPLGLGFGESDAAPGARAAGDGAYPDDTYEYAPDGRAASDDAETGYDWGLVGDPNGIDPRASEGPRDTAALLDSEQASDAVAGATPTAGFASLAAAGLADPEPAGVGLVDASAVGASGRFDPTGEASTATAAAAAPLAAAGGGRGSDPAVGGARSGDSGAGASGGGRPPRPLLWIAGGLALLVVLAGLFFVGTKLPLGEKSGATGGAATTAAPDESTAAAPAAPTAAQPAGVHAWNTLFGGECLEPFTDAWAAEYTVVECAAPHAAQLVLRGTVAGDAAAPYPGDAELATQLTAACRAPGVFDDAAIAGIPDLQVVFSFPVADQWAAGERTFYCFANRSSGEPLTVSIAGATPSQVVAG